MWTSKTFQQFINDKIRRMSRFGQFWSAIATAGLQKTELPALITRNEAESIALSAI
jgi:hypothetical protein